MKIAFSGHRPNYFRHPELEEIRFVETLAAYLSTITEPYTTIVGGARGVDAWAAKYSLSHKIPFDLYVPFDLKTHVKTRKGTKEDGYFLLEQHKYCVKKRVVSDMYDVEAYFKRDMWMAEDCDLLISWYFKPNSGTGECVKYAESIGKPVIKLRTWKG